jgi:hypothetical protein
MLALDDLRCMSLAELEELWRSSALGPRPLGCFRGEFLHWIDSPGARRPHVRALDTLGFRASPFGIDFDDARWWFIHPRLRIGKFALTEGRSRWRATEAHRLAYELSKLPKFVRGALYDEVKQLSGSVALGLGGLNAGPGEGDHFFFALARR